MVGPSGPLAAIVIGVERATDVVVGGVDAEQPATANKIVASTSEEPICCRAVATRLRHICSLPSTASERDAIRKRQPLCRSLCVEHAPASRFGHGRWDPGPAGLLVEGGVDGMRE